ncbi:hypothetical protein [Methylophilus sp. 3sh_L]|uniref:hypothetical protein n=1 Tax=Methylophilus sp. 3sh_L TaxID=3377114 RepID=UPI00398F31C7
MPFNHYACRFFTAIILCWLAGCCTPKPTSILQPVPLKTATESNVALHVIGVYQGVLPASADQRPWWEQCQADRAASGKRGPVTPGECDAFLRTGRDQRTVTVNISDDSKPIILGLMAYEPVTWHIVRAPGVVIQKVILGAYHPQIIEGLEEVQVDVYSYDNIPCPRCVQKGHAFYSYERVPLEMELVTGMHATSFQGNYTGGSYQIFKGMQ